MTNIDLNQVLTPSGRAAKFPTVGTTHKGTVVHVDGRQKNDINGNPEFTKAGKPKPEAVITLDTDLHEDEEDDGIRKLYASGQMLYAIGEAIGKAGVNFDNMTGGTLAVKFDREKPSETRGFNPQKIYVAQFKTAEPAPAAPALELVVADDLI